MAQPKSSQLKKSFALVLFGFLVLSLLLSHDMFSTAYADTTTWARTYGGSGFEHASSISQTSDGGYVIAGYTNSFGLSPFNTDIWVLKLDPDGNVEWEKTYGGPNSDQAYSIQQTADSGYIVAGQTAAFESSDSAWLLKLDSDGNVEWEKAYGTEASEPFLRFQSVQQTSDGGYVVGGTKFGSNSVWVVRLDSDGNIEWENTLAGPSGGEITSMQQTAEGGSIVAAHTQFFGGGSDDAWIIKLGTDGNIEWEKIYGSDSGDYAFSIQQTSDGGYIAVGSIGGVGDAWLLKVDSDGNIDWEKVYHAAGSNVRADSVSVTSDGGYIVAGATNPFIDGSNDAWLLKVDSGGDLEWQKAYGGSGAEAEFEAEVQQTADGGYIVASDSVSFETGQTDIWILKLDSEGNIENCVDLLQDSNAGATDGAASVENSTASVDSVEPDVEETNATVQDSFALIKFPCGDYAIDLYENTNDPSDGVIDMNEELRAIARTTDSSVEQAAFRWIDPNGDIAREVTVPISSSEDVFAPSEPGHWTVEAEFSNGGVVKTLSVGFFVPLDGVIIGVGWDGGGDGVNWSDCDNWIGDACPTASDDVTVVSGSSVVLDIDFALASGHGLNIQGGAELELSSGVELSGDLNSFISNFGTLNNPSGGNILTTLFNKPDGVTNNEGTIGVIFNNAEGVINNDGTIDIFDNSDNEGIINNNLGATISVWSYSGPFTNEETGTINNFGTITTGEESRLTNDGTIQNSGRLFIDKDVRFGNSGTIINKCDGVIEFFYEDTEPPGEVINEPCTPYELNLFENNDDPSDLVVDLGDEVRAVAETDVSEVTQVTFRWIDPSSNVDETIVAPLSGGAAEDTFTPDEQGTWTVEADFGNGQLIQKTLDISFFVVPESPVGVIAIVVSSLAVLGLFTRLRSRSTS